MDPHTGSFLYIRGNKFTNLRAYNKAQIESHNFKKQQL